MASSQLFLLALFVATSSLVVIASDPSSLQDFCVAGLNSTGINIYKSMTPKELD